jgi:hypothetical protein
MPVTGYTRVDDNDFEKLIPLAQTAAALPPKRLIDDGDITAQINALQVAAGIPANQRTNLLDRQDWEKYMIALQGKLNMRTATLSIASPAVVTLATHGWVAGQAFQFATTPGGTAINTTGTQSGVQSVYAA